MADFQNKCHLNPNNALGLRNEGVLANRISSCMDFNIAVYPELSRRAMVKDKN
jgi:hypothetical protein